MQRLEVSGAVRPVYGSLGVKGLTNLMHKICFTISFISCLYMFRTNVLIIRRSKFHYTDSGIIIPIHSLIPDCFTTSFISCLYMFRAHSARNM